MSEYTGARGTAWFRALTGNVPPMTGDPRSVLTADASIGDTPARFLCVVPDPLARFPCARHGEVGLEEAYTLHTGARMINEDRNAVKRPVIAIVDVKSQAYGRREETAAIFLAAAAAADAYGSARLADIP